MKSAWRSLRPRESLYHRPLASADDNHAAERETLLAASEENSATLQGGVVYWRVQ